MRCKAQTYKNNNKKIYKHIIGRYGIYRNYNMHLPVPTRFCYFGTVSRTEFSGYRVFGIFRDRVGRESVGSGQFGKKSQP
jgi:hypothetical protein